MFFNHSASNESTARACSAGLGLCVPCALLGDLDPRLRAQREFGHLQMARVRRPDECEELRETLNKGASRVLCCAWQGRSGITLPLCRYRSPSPALRAIATSPNTHSPFVDNRHHPHAPRPRSRPVKERPRTGSLRHLRGAPAAPVGVVLPGIWAQAFPQGEAWFVVGSVARHCGWQSGNAT